MSAAKPGDPGEIFADVIELPESERAAFLDRSCAGDRALRAEVESLLAHHALADGWMRGPERDGGPDPQIGRAFGSWRAVEVIASGGMGTVYLAERTDREFEKRAALKVVRAGLGTPELRARFRAERQLLAQLEHPHIARLLDGGTTPEGAPFLVLEYVDGMPIDRWADERALTIEGRLRLFLDVCGAVAHAHRGLIVHRDLKPGNIFVTPAGEVKLLDFGIAKALASAQEDAGAEATLLRALTPQYASPEQMRGLPITTASDVYSLGVVLHLLLAGAPPYSTAGLSPADAERMVCEHDTPAASAIAAQVSPDVAARRGAITPRKLARSLEGDLDNMLARAMSRDVARRYGGAEEFADDVRRHLEGDPVRARPDSAGYRAAKFARKHRGVVAAAATIAALLVAIALTSGLLSRRVARERDAAREAGAEAAAVNEFLVRVLGAANPGAPDALGKDASLREALDRASGEVERGTLAATPGVEAAVRGALGTAYQGLGLYPEAEPHLARAVELRVRHGGATSEVTAAAISALAALRLAAGNLAGADSLLSRALIIREKFRRTDPTALAGCQSDLGVVRWERGDAAGAESLYRAAIALQRARPGEDRRNAAAARSNLALLLAERGDLADAEALSREAVELLTQELGPSHPDVASALNGLGKLLNTKGDALAADSVWRQVVAIRRRTLGDSHPDLASALNNLASARRGRGDLAGAEPMQREAVRIWRAALGDAHPLVATGIGNLATLASYQGRYAAAESLYLESLALRRVALGGDHPDVALSLYQLAVLELDAGLPRRAEQYAKQALALRRGKLGDDHVDTAESEAVLGRWLMASGRAAEAVPVLRRSLVVQDAKQASGWRRHETESLLGAALAATGRRDEGEPLLVRSAGKLDSLASAPAVRRRQAAERVVALYETSGSAERAAQWRRRATQADRPR